VAGTEPKPSLDERLFADHEAARSGAAQADMDRVTESAARQGFDVVQASAARRTVRVSGTVAQANRVFATDLSPLRHPCPQPFGRRINTIRNPSVSLNLDSSFNSQYVMTSRTAQIGVPINVSEIC
jgi:hypothetical protein